MTTLPPIIQPIEADTTRIAQAGRVLSEAWAAFADALAGEPEHCDAAMESGIQKQEYQAAYFATEEEGKPVTPEWQVQVMGSLGFPFTELVTADLHRVQDGWVHFHYAPPGEPVASYPEHLVRSIRLADGADA